MWMYHAELVTVVVVGSDTYVNRVNCEVAEPSVHSLIIKDRCLVTPEIAALERIVIIKVPVPDYCRGGM